ncbi:PAS domain S-box protein [Fodinibius sp. Rm-B-1B1-1]|uniref:PAS domain-containing sensor histidine kinase n=1 Tax=Fodinibius alkaliphilus TaxID=3140241 RepID=UPI00315AB908
MPKQERPDSREVLEHISQCVITTDLNGIVTYWNRGCEQIFGYDRMEMINKSLSKIYPFVAEEQFHHDLEMLRSGEEVRGQWKSITKYGEIIWIDVHAKPLFDKQGNPKAVIASAHDIGPLKAVEKELEESKAQAQAILETTVDGIITIDKYGEIMSFNYSASRIFGYSEDEATGINIKNLVAEPHGKDPINHLDKYQSNEVVGYRRELSGKRKNGSVFPMELSVSEVDWEGSQIYTVVVNDISDRRQLEKEILRISEEERRSLGQDLHDGLGQMLTGIYLISKNLAQKLETNDLPGHKEIQEISDMVKEADEYAKVLARGLVYVDMKKEGLNAALKQLAGQVEKLFNITCSVNMKEDININNDMQGMHLYRIAQESISNAVKHGKANNIEIGLNKKNGSLQLSIKDNGIGFAKSQEEKKESGMGIHIMRYRANMLSGRLEIFETGDQKTNVVCSIPFNN